MTATGIATCVVLLLFIAGGFITNWGDGDRNNSLRTAAVLYLVLMSFSVGVHVGSRSTLEDKVEPAVDFIEEETEQGLISQKESE